jgi:hypothetical protein
MPLLILPLIVATICIVIGAIAALVLIGGLIGIGLVCFALLWLGTFVAYVLFHKDKKPPSNNYHIDQGKEV